MKVISLTGARPQYIKESVLNYEFKKRGIAEILVNSGQHYDFNMSDIFFKSLKITKPKYNLKVGSGKHGEMTGKIMIEFEKIVEKEKPDVIVVYGDTNTTLAGALVAAKLKIPLAHVEAGLRMKPKNMPEEINRVATDHMANFLFTPSKLCSSNLKREGITKGVFFTGDVTYDLFLHMKKMFNINAYKKYGLVEETYAVLTMHRDYNVDLKQKLKDFLVAFQQINKDIPIIFPIHPRTRKRIIDFGLDKYIEKIKIIEPIEYFELMGLVSKSKFVITDSGGLQKEAYFAGKPGLVIMPDTGWVELLKSGTNTLCNENNLVSKAAKIVSKEVPKGLYGIGNAGKKIAKILRFI
jgi:UDP-N-acetylglucosamine 2-epimerase (non-hydrolysing)